MLSSGLTLLHASRCPDADGALWALQMPHQDVLLTIVNAKGWTDERHVDCIGAAVPTANQRVPCD
jgi:hypothetical protein